MPPRSSPEAHAHGVAAALARDARGREARAREALGDPERELRDARRLVRRALAHDERLEVGEETLLPRGKERREDARAAHARSSVTTVVYAREDVLPHRDARARDPPGPA